MLHVNRLDGLTIAVSENPYITRNRQPHRSQPGCAHGSGPDPGRCPGMEELKDPRLFWGPGFTLREWDKVRTDTITLCATGPRKWRRGRNNAAYT